MSTKRKKQKPQPNPLGVRPQTCSDCGAVHDSPPPDPHIAGAFATLSMLNGHPVWRRLPREARDRGLNAAVVFLEVMNILHDAVGVPYGFATVEAPEDTAAVTHLADQLAAELLGSLPR